MLDKQKSKDRASQGQCRGEEAKIRLSAFNGRHISDGRRDAGGTTSNATSSCGKGEHHRFIDQITLIPKNCRIQFGT
jgi:hypothetical protein